MHNFNSKRIKQTRKNLICYFLSMAKAYQAIQHLQQELAMHPYFHPILIFKKISKGQSTIKKSNYIEYIESSIGGLPQKAIAAYMKKHDLGQSIQCQQFFASILPFNPDILRNSLATIVWQVKSTPFLKKQVESLFRQLVACEIMQIVKISHFRRHLVYKWSELKALIEKDVKQKGTILSKRSIQEMLNMNTVRKWMELWIDINERDILDMIRWMLGSQEQDIKRNYQTVFKEVICSCQFSKQQTCALQSIKLKQEQKKTAIENLRSLSLKPLSKKQQQMLERKIKLIKRAKSTRKQSSNSHAVSSKIRSNKESTTNANSKKLQSEYKQCQFDERARQLWIQYLCTILTGEKTLKKMRQYLKFNIESVARIIGSEFMGKGYPATQITAIIQFILQYAGLPIYEKSFLQRNLSNLQISNQVLISIFTVGLPNQLQNKMQDLMYSHNQKQHKNDEDGKQLRKAIADTLKNYFLIKCKLIQIARQITQQKLAARIFALLDTWEVKAIGRQNLVQFMAQVNMQQTEQQIQLLLKHFGNSTIITQESFSRVFQIQSN